ncbi:hypothetical protein FEF22_000280 [Texas Phoenix palm phytoplasma]|uniref:Effector n=1 Tax=Texas Phoenix palm phytoplasma TaxID=176709 RepID=A0ABS5BI18_9MOLU|nr:hypothetical protein [Texas Phoenix palm phytoplasma]MBP3059226.1 hypothetical protein [Texas Phoenix palm phytoplasma]
MRNKKYFLFIIYVLIFIILIILSLFNFFFSPFFKIPLKEVNFKEKKISEKIKEIIPEVTKEITSKKIIPENNFTENINKNINKEEKIIESQIIENKIISEDKNEENNLNTNSKSEEELLEEYYSFVSKPVIDEEEEVFSNQKKNYLSNIDDIGKTIFQEIFPELTHFRDIDIRGKTFDEVDEITEKYILMQNNISSEEKNKIVNNYHYKPWFVKFSKNNEKNLLENIVGVDSLLLATTRIPVLF